MLADVAPDTGVRRYTSSDRPGVRRSAAGVGRPPVPADAAWSIIRLMTYADEIRRKLIHLGSAAFPLGYWLSDRATMLAVLVPLAVIAVGAETLRRHHRGFHAFIQRWLGRLFREHEAGRFTGATYVTVANLLAVACLPKPIAVTALLFLSVSDALAGLVGRRFGRIRFLGKSLIGSATFLVSAAAIAGYFLPEALPVGLAGAVVATLVEAQPLRVGRHELDDNLAIPLISGALMTAVQTTLS